MRQWRCRSIARSGWAAPAATYRPVGSPHRRGAAERPLEQRAPKQMWSRCDVRSAPDRRRHPVWAIGTRERRPSALGQVVLSVVETLLVEILAVGAHGHTRDQQSVRTALRRGLPMLQSSSRVGLHEATHVAFPYVDTRTSPSVARTGPSRSSSASGTACKVSGRVGGMRWLPRGTDPEVARPPNRSC